MVDLFDEDFQIMTNIRKLSDTAHDKLVFTVRFLLRRLLKSVVVIID